MLDGTILFYHCILWSLKPDRDMIAASRRCMHSMACKRNNGKVHRTASKGM
jgi:hypothetical protein